MSQGLDPPSERKTPCQQAVRPTRQTTPSRPDSAELLARAFEVLLQDAFMANGQAMADAGNPFPYSLGPECTRTCEALAAVVRAYRNEFRQTLPLTNPQSV